jgi:hypothetical protein
MDGRMEGDSLTAAGHKLVMAIPLRPSRSKSTASPMVKTLMPNLPARRRRAIEFHVNIYIHIHIHNHNHHDDDNLPP